MNTYDRIVELCETAGISIYRLEKELGFGKTAIMKWKESSPNSSALLKIAEKFEVSVDYLLGKEEIDYYIDPETKKIAEDIYANPDLRILFDASRKASPESMRRMKDMFLIMLGENYEDAP